MRVEIVAKATGIFAVAVVAIIAYTMIATTGNSGTETLLQSFTAFIVFLFLALACCTKLR